MLTEKNYIKNTHEHSNYSALIQKIIARKKFSTLKKAFVEGQKSAQKTYEPFLEEWKNTVKKLQNAKINLITKHAEELVQESLEKNPKDIIAMVLKLLKNIAEHTDIELTTHGIDAQIIRESLNEITLSCSSARKVTILEDDTFKRGSLVIKANKSIIDAHIATQINKAKEILLTSTES